MPAHCIPAQNEASIHQVLGASSHFTDIQILSPLTITDANPYFR
jgi:hypothetical protein